MNLQELEKKEKELYNFNHLPNGAERQAKYNKWKVVYDQITRIVCGV